MITGKDIYDVLAAIVPLYVAMLLAYGSVKWWNIFTPAQCSGINRFVAVFAVPLLSFHFISTNNPYAMNYHFIAADSLQKVVILVALVLWHNLSKRSNLDWTITLFSLSTLPNTLVMGIPLLKAMYGEFSGSLMVQIVVLQSVIWYTLMLFMFEYRGAKALINEQFPDVAASITSFKVDSDVISLNGRDPLQADAEIGEDGKLHVVVRKSTSTRSMVSSYNKSHGLASVTPRASNLTGVEIYSLQSSREPTPRGSSFNQSDFYAMFTNKMAIPSPKTSGGVGVNGGLGEEVGMRLGKSGSGVFGSSSSGYPTPNPLVSGSTPVGGKSKEGSGAVTPAAVGGAAGSNNKELHMFVWSSSASPVSEANLRYPMTRTTSADFGNMDSSKMVYQQELGASKGLRAASENTSPNRKGGDLEIEEGVKIPNRKATTAGASPLSSSKNKVIAGPEVVQFGENNQRMPPTSVMTRLIVIMVWRKLIRNPNTYSSLFGLTWSLISFRFNIEMPSIVQGSISILSDAGLGMAMFSLGLFMALQPKIIACGKSVASFSMVVRFLTGPAVMAATSIGIGIRGVLLHVAIVQAALPQGIVPFVFAKEYNCHPDILSTAVIFGMLIALPITILYYVLLGV